MTLLCLCCLPAVGAGKVTISENQSSFILDNGIITATVSKWSGNLTSLTYKHLQMLDVTEEGASGGYWEYDVSRDRHVTGITIDPNSNGGERGEVSVKGFYNTNSAGGRGNLAANLEMRYALASGDSGLYTYCIFTHPTNYTATSVGEARFCAKLNDSVFDWMTVDANRNFRLITAYDWDHGTELNLKEVRRMNTGALKGTAEHKYDYTADQFDTRAWGWSSSAKDVGIWFINPSVEYLSGGPTKLELGVHRDATFTDSLTAPAAPCLLNYWRSSHYGGAVCNIASNEDWTKIIGPFLIYCDAAGSHNAMWHSALKRADMEMKAWPYDWVEGVDYPHQDERATVDGQLMLDDPQAPGLREKNLLVGLTAPSYIAPRVGFRNFGGFTNEDGSVSTNSFQGRRRNGNGGGFGGFGGFGFPRGPQTVDWQNDAKNYEFWVRGNSRGDFSIPNVRPGKYTLHAIADGVLGEYVMTNVTVNAGVALHLGKLAWQPVRYGQQLWDIGIPNRTSGEFFKGNDYFHWGWYVQYPKLFPNDVNYTIGKSNFRKDWFFEQVPHDEELSDTNGKGHGRSTTWTINFNLPQASSGTATLRLAICGVGTRQLAVTVNDQSVGTVTNLIYNATIDRDGIEGAWSEHDVTFNASLMKAGPNVMKLTIPAGSLVSGIMYDYLRLELDSSKPYVAMRQ
ncbi:MAG TPA: polysaccharide lyase family protein [Verrucomicrobiae bacterium]